MTTVRRTTGFHAFPFDFKHQNNGFYLSQGGLLPKLRYLPQYQHRPAGALEAEDTLITEIPAELFPLKSDGL